MDRSNTRRAHPRVPSAEPNLHSAILTVEEAEALSTKLAEFIEWKKTSLAADVERPTFKALVVAHKAAANALAAAEKRQDTNLIDFQSAAFAADAAVLQAGAASVKAAAAKKRPDADPKDRGPAAENAARGDAAFLEVLERAAAGAAANAKAAAAPAAKAAAAARFAAAAKKRQDADPKDWGPAADAAFLEVLERAAAEAAVNAKAAAAAAAKKRQDANLKAFEDAANAKKRQDATRKNWGPGAAPFLEEWDRVAAEVAAEAAAAAHGDAAFLEVLERAEAAANAKAAAAATPAAAKAATAKAFKTVEDAAAGKAFKYAAAKNFKTVEDAAAGKAFEDVEDAEAMSPEFKEWKKTNLAAAATDVEAEERQDTNLATAATDVEVEEAAFKALAAAEDRQDTNLVAFQDADFKALKALQAADVDSEDWQDTNFEVTAPADVDSIVAGVEAEEPQDDHFEAELSQDYNFKALKAAEARILECTNITALFDAADAAIKALAAAEERQDTDLMAFRAAALAAIATARAAGEKWQDTREAAAAATAHVESKERQGTNFEDLEAGVTSAKAAAAVSIPMAASSASIKGAAGSEEKGQTTQSPQQREIGKRAIVVVLTAVVPMAVSILALVRFDENPMFQVWILSVSICSSVFIFLLCIWRTRWFYIDLARLTYAPLLAFTSGSAIGSATATFVLFFGMVWAAGILGYSLALHHLRKGTVSTYALPSPSRPTKDSVEKLNFGIYVVAPFVLLLWTLFVALLVNIATPVDELVILHTLSYFGWIHVTAWIHFVATTPMHGFPVEELMPTLVPPLLSWMLVSPVLVFVSLILSVLCHLLLMLALVAFLWYNLAIYMHFLETAAPRILEDKVGQVKSDPRLGETPSEAAATLLMSN